VALALACAACASNAPDPDDRLCRAETLVANELRHELDVLFVIDTSPSMRDEYDRLRTNMRRFGAAISSLANRPSLHIGVISADVGAGGFGITGCNGEGGDGNLHIEPRFDGCTGPDGAYITDVRAPLWADCTGEECRARNYDGSLADVVECIGSLPPEGCPFIQPLEATKRAIEIQSAIPDGMIRDEALLLLVYVVDSDDCSADDETVFDPQAGELGAISEFRCTEFGVTCAEGTPAREPGSYSDCAPTASSYLGDVDAYTDVVAGLKPHPGMVFAAVVSGGAVDFDVVDTDDGRVTVDPVCTDDDISAKHSVRLSTAMQHAFPQHFSQRSICDEDWSEVLIDVTSNFATTLGLPCFAAGTDTSDVNTELAGLQVDCDVTFVPHDYPEQASAVPACEMIDATTVSDSSPTPCWWTWDTGGDEPCRYQVQLEGLEYPPRDGNAIVDCAAVCGQ
jgi:hypothetical protein